MKLKNKIKIAGLTGLAAVCLSGCTQEDIGGALIKTYSQTPARDQYAANRRIVAGLTADVLAKEADAKRAEDVARAGATRVEQNVKVGVNENKNIIPLEVGKTYEIVLTSKSSNPSRICKAKAKFSGFGGINFGRGWETAYKFDALDGGTYTIALSDLISAKPIE